MIKTIALVSIGAVAALAIPSFASTASNTVSLTPGQINFINQLDRAGNTTLSSLMNTPGAIPIIKSASLACGNIPLQKKAVLALGGTEQDATYASLRFQTDFCSSTAQ
jgi:hypothetical protein